MQKGIITKDEAAARAERIRQYFDLHPEDKETQGLRLDVGLFAMNLMQVVRVYGYDSVPSVAWILMLLKPISTCRMVGNLF